jgi:hypothetical protein
MRIPVKRDDRGVTRRVFFTCVKRHADDREEEEMSIAIAARAELESEV